MKFVSVTDENGALLPFSRYLIDAVAFFGGDFVSIDQAKALLAIEYKAWSSGPKDYKPSDLVLKLLEASEKKAEAVYATGLVGLAVFGLQAIGRKASFEHALSLVETYTGSSFQTDFIHWNPDTKRFDTVAKNVASNKRALRRSIESYRSVIHVCTARVVANEYLEPSMPFESAPIAEESYLATVAAFQQFFSKYDQVDRDKRSKKLDIFHIAWQQPFVLKADPLLPTDELMRAILGDLA